MMCAPFLVAAGLFASMLLAPWTGMTGPSSNTYFLLGVAATGIGIIAGVAGLLRMRRSQAWVRVLVGLLYVPTILISLLLSGA